MKTTKLLLVLFAAAGLGLGSGAGAQTMSKDAHDNAYKNAESQYKTDKAACDSLSGNAKDICVEEAKGKEKMACDSLSGNAKDICVEEAKGKEKIAKAEADAAYKNTPKAREAARTAHADAAHEVAKEKCDDLSGNQKDVCVKEAKAAHVKAVADAKVDRVAADTRNTAADKTAAARRDATEDKRDADYKVAIEKCDAMSGSAKDTCVSNAKARYGK